MVITTVVRALRKRCPACGRARIFTRFFTLVPRCPSCGYSFEREEGYFLGAVAVNTVVTQAVFMTVLLGGIALSWPEVPWTALLVGGLVVTGLFPVWFYPLSKSLWIALDLVFRPVLGRDDETVAAGRVSSADPRDAASR